MRTTLVYDLPTRLFHWLFAGLFLLSFVISKTIDDESLLFSYHMLSGIMLSGLVVWRIIWGLIGSEHARFTGFNLNPFELKDYFLGIVSGSKKRWVGHNPASSWAAITMFTLAAGLGVTGYLMSSGGKEIFEDAHELMANTFIVVAVLHVAGIILHSLRHQDAIAFSMMDGKKEVSDGQLAIKSSHSFASVLLLALVVSGGLFLYKNFDSQNRSLRVFGQTLQLGESEQEDDDNENEKSDHETEEENDDD